MIPEVASSRRQQNEGEDWPFDQEPNVAAITTGQVIELGYPILHVSHYEDDHSWSFLCGTTEDSEDHRLVDMADVFNRDDGLRSIANLPPGWSAWRNNPDSEWERYQEDQTDE